MTGPNPAKADFVRTIPDGDTMERDVCATCGYIAYDNPKVVVGSVARQGPKVLLCRRAIFPRRGYWTLPAGFLEVKETPDDGARREAREEAHAELTLHGLLAVYTIPRISQVQLIFRATLENEPYPGEESLEVGLFSYDDIPWDEIAFPSVRWALTQDQSLGDAVRHPPFRNPPGEWGD